MNLRLLLLAGVTLAAIPAFGEDSAPVSATITVTASVGNICHLGTPANSTIELGALAAESDGSLVPISPPSTAIQGSWCNAGSTISVFATPLIAQNYGAGAPPANFTKAVNFKVTASGWTSPAAFYTTTGDVSGSQSNVTPGTASASIPVAQTITVDLSNFASPVAGYRLVADTNYSSTITVTLTAAP